MSLDNFVDTSISEQVTNVLTYAQRLAWLVSIQGPPGIGKTTAVQQYKERAEGKVWIYTARRDTAAIGPFLRDLAIYLAGTADQRVADNIRSVLTAVRYYSIEHPALLVIDEAQNLKADTLEELRQIYDEGRFGIAFIGNHTFVDRYNNDRQNLVTSPQFRSRLKIACDLQSVEADDAQRVARAHGISDAGVIKQLGLLARGPKGLRCVEGVADLAVELAGEEQPSAADYRNAFTILSHG